MASALPNFASGTTIDGDWERDGILIVRKLFDSERIQRLQAVADQLLDIFYRSSDGRQEGATSIFQVHDPSKFFPVGSWQLREILEAAADPKVVELARTCCCGGPAADLSEDPLFSHTSIFFNSRDDGANAKRTESARYDSSGCCGEWHRDAQYIKPIEAQEKQLVLQPDEEPGGRMFQIQCALLPSQHFEYVRGSHARWDTAEEYRIRKGRDSGVVPGAQLAGSERVYRFSDKMPGAERELLQPGDALVFNPWVLHRGHYTERAGPRRSFMWTYGKGPRASFYANQSHLDGFTDQPWMLEPEYTTGLTTSAKRVFAKFVSIYGPHIRQANTMGAVQAAESKAAQRPKL
eukprot:SAG31_NODE_2873_length_4972_cov_3.088241_5_plen_349_part_00